MKISSFMALIGVMWLGIAFILDFAGASELYCIGSVVMNQMWFVGAFILEGVNNEGKS